MTERLSPYKLHQMAGEEYPGDEPYDDACRILRYHELMIEHGHVIAKTDPDDDGSLPCGWKPGGRK